MSPAARRALRKLVAERVALWGRKGTMEGLQHLHQRVDAAVFDAMPADEPGRTLEELRDWLGYAAATRESQVLVASLARLRKAQRLLVHDEVRRHTRAPSAAVPEPVEVDHHRDVRCDSCGVSADKACRGKSGERVTSHLARVRASQALRARRRLAEVSEPIAAGWKPLLVSFQHLGLR